MNCESIALNDTLKWCWGQVSRWMVMIGNGKLRCGKVKFWWGVVAYGMEMLSGVVANS